jgi:CheY-like chemotaxis protein
MREGSASFCGTCRLRAATLIDGLLARRSSKRCVLIVNDIPEICEFIGLILDFYGYETHAAADGVDALRMARTLRPDLILLNVMMPRMDGLEALGRLKKDPVLRNLKVVMHSARSDDDFQQRTFELGAVDFLKVPFSKQGLLTVVRRALLG